jgi:hypothetical protein
VELQVDQPEPIVVPAIVKVDDSKLKRVSISTNFLLFSDAGFRVDQHVLELLNSLKSKYRMFLITKVPEEDGPLFKAAQACFTKMIADGVVQPHRIMFC